MENENKINVSKIRLFCCLLLALLIFAVYFQTPEFDFVHYDDHVYVTDNLRVKAGLTVENICWSFTSLDAGFWHPLTWLSLMLDHDLYGLNAGGYHLTNLLFHIINTILLFIVLGRMTGALWRSFFVAALFALHPLHVEPVAWIASRKDVLSTFFMMLTLGGYYWYVQRPGVLRYSVVVIMFLMGLMAKPVLVTLPFVLLLLDWWPLNRFRTEQSVPDFKFLQNYGNIGRLVWEKAPLLVLAVGVSVATVIAEGRAGALKPMVSYALDVRLGNALVSYVLYIGKMLWPVNLAVFYPHPGLWPVWVIASSVLFLGTVSYWSISRLRKYPYFATGWFWYLGTLVPVIGLVQVGSHAMADRYTYIPLIGLFMVIVWGSVDICRRFQCSMMILRVSAVVVLTALSIQSYVQVQYWKDAIQLFRHAINVTKGNYIAHNNLGAALSRQGRSAEALDQLRAALRIMPQYREALFNMGVALADQGKYFQAVEYYQRILVISPRFAEAHNNLAIALACQGQLEEAISHFRTALTIRPDYADARNNLQIAGQELQNRLKKNDFIQ